MNARTSLTSSRSRSSSSSSKARKSENGVCCGSIESVMAGSWLVQLLGQEVVDRGGELAGLGQDAEVAAVVDVEPRVGDQAREHAGVDQRDDRVVVAPHDEGRLPQQRQERQAGPAGHRRELVVVAALRAGARRRVEKLSPAAG